MCRPNCLQLSCFLRIIHLTRSSLSMSTHIDHQPKLCIWGFRIQYKLITYPDICSRPALVPSATGYVHSTPSSKAMGKSAKPNSPNPIAPTATHMPKLATWANCITSKTKLGNLIKNVNCTRIWLKQVSGFWAISLPWNDVQLQPKLLLDRLEFCRAVF